MQQGIEERFTGRSKSRNTRTPRAVHYLGYGTQKCGRLFHVRKNVADEREDHLSILTVAGAIV